MSTKLSSYPYTVLEEIALTSSAISQSTIVQYRDNIGYEISWANGSGTPDGTFIVQVQNHADDPWATLDLGSVITLSGTNGTHTINLNQLPYHLCRIAFSYVSGQVDLKITVVTKKIGG